MKPTKLVSAIFLFIVLLLSSCNGKTTANVVNTSPNQKVITNVSATRSTSVDPWKVVLKVKAYTFKEGKLEFEIYANDITDQNVKFNWQDDKNCIITFEQREDKPRTFQLIADGGQLQLGEI